MSSPASAIMTGTFTSDGAAHDISLLPGYTEFQLINLTDIGDAGATTPVMKATGSSSMPAGYGYYSTKTNGAATIDIEIHTATGGFTWIGDSAIQTPGVAVAITDITQAAPAVVSSASAAIVGDIVRVYATTAMLEVASLDFSVTAVTAGVDQTLGYLDSSAFGAAATAGFIRVIPSDKRFYPRNRYITGITQAASAVVTLSVTHGFTVGQEVRVTVPVEFGMEEINGLSGTVTAINAGTNTITLDINSTAFTAFAFPTSAIAAAGVTHPQITPIGESASYGDLDDDATDNVSYSGVRIGTTVQTTAKKYQWIAIRGITV